MPARARKITKSTTSTNAGIAAAEAFQFRGSIEVFPLNADRHDQPPVTGGNRAISSSGRTGWSCSTYSWLIATLITFLFLFAIVSIVAGYIRVDQEGVESWSLLTAIIPLTTYTLLILFRSNVAGLQSISAEVLEAAEGMGYTPRERLRLPPHHVGRLAEFRRHLAAAFLHQARSSSGNLPRTAACANGRDRVDDVQRPAFAR